MKVVVIGAGIGGLVLAHTLRGFGVDVHVYDRDVDLECTGSYRLHLDSNATDVLRRRISPEAYRALLASASGPEMFRQVSVLDQSMRQLVRIPNIAGEDDMLIGRIPLRTILAVGLDDVVHFLNAATVSGVAGALFAVQAFAQSKTATDADKPKQDQSQTSDPSDPEAKARRRAANEAAAKQRKAAEGHWERFLRRLGLGHTFIVAGAALKVEIGPRQWRGQKFPRHGGR